MREWALDASPTALIVVDRKGNLAIANRQARNLFGLNPHHLERPFQDLELSYRPVELRSLIEEVYEHRSSRMVNNVQMNGPGSYISPQYFNVTVEPLEEAGGRIAGVSIAFADTTGFNKLQAELQQSNQELETALEELETMNEELQSTNEELETMNEELQSTNEELETLNEELRHRTDELYQINAFQDSIVAGLSTGIIVMDRALAVQTWNAACEELWGLRAGEVQGQPFLSLDIGLPVTHLESTLHQVLSEKSKREGIILSAVNRRGRSIACRITCTPLFGVGSEIEGVIMMIQEIRSADDNAGEPDV